LLVRLTLFLLTKVGESLGDTLLLKEFCGAAIPAVPRDVLLIQDQSFSLNINKKNSFTPKTPNKKKTHKVILSFQF